MPIIERLRVAIVGSGPSGFYAAEALLNARRDVEIDIFDRLPVPFGLVRYGVAPDHQKLKLVTAVFTKLASDPRIRFFGNIEIGTALPLGLLRDHYHAVVLASGASSDRKMGVPNEDLAGSYSAVDFVGWYNGHPDHRDLTFDLSGDQAVIVGQGNVAIDVCRILTKPVDELAKTDIARHALEVLASSQLRSVWIVGRRGPVQAKFTTKELRELGELPGWDVCVDPADLVLNETSATELADPRSAATIAKNYEILRGFAARARSNERKIQLAFCASPHSIEGFGFAGSMTFERTTLSGSPFAQRAERSGAFYTLGASAIFRSVGYAGLPFPGLPFDRRNCVISNKDGRVVDEDGEVVGGVYVTGWIKRGPTGIIGTNRVDSIATIARLLEDCDALPSPAEADFAEVLNTRGCRWTTFPDWQRIDAKELEDGRVAGCVRQKMVAHNDLMAFASGGGVPTHAPS